MKYLKEFNAETDYTEWTDRNFPYVARIVNGNKIMLAKSRDTDNCVISMPFKITDGWQWFSFPIDVASWDEFIEGLDAEGCDIIVVRECIGSDYISIKEGSTPIPAGSLPSPHCKHAYMIRLVIRTGISAHITNITLHGKHVSNDESYELPADIGWVWVPIRMVNPGNMEYYDASNYYHNSIIALNGYTFNYGNRIVSQDAVLTFCTDTVVTNKTPFFTECTRAVRFYTNLSGGEGPILVKFVDPSENINSL